MLSPMAQALRRIVIDIDYDLAKDIDTPEDEESKTWEDYARDLETYLGQELAFVRQP